MFDGKTALYVAGSNGSGKSTLIAALAKTDILQNFIHINPDIIVREKGLRTDRRGYAEAYREADNRIEQAVNEGRNILRESVTMSPRKLINLKKSGYDIYILFIGTDDSNINILNVANRVRNGGHDVPIKTILKRHENAIKNVQQAIPYCSCLVAFDNSVPGEAPISCVAISDNAICFQNEQALEESDWIKDLIKDITDFRLDEEKSMLCQLLQKEVDEKFIGFSLDEDSKYVDFSSKVDYPTNQFEPR